ncbi:tRNA (N6-isopentenyl adenosine(37)-C2)-methylthiotransferase MiaB [Micromonospora lupini]|uniref:tRNA (N6-isopentenyl adenosine(37)-C2)-methylthiotransferase MiaB n=1 Tax=Micromonospora lupini TaxID=285679 RepID=UPI002254404C|nr:tRNA (N6-isopentenyl adenosine(37)-C2)-methylthiotransferase MiaB [Micromonospora lupini]MCX5070575.1 tRNA (N6-isopentenyl adenosine(37)-C2)-methylthiotransferase MiaB [Micromonospora lupini]
MTTAAAGSPRTYQVRTYGCQMNVHDSERISGLLEQAGYVRAPQADDTPDIVVFNTCAVRENADNRLYGNLGHLRPVKDKHPGMQIAVGGCLAQKDRGEIVRRAPWVDVVFGTHNIGALPVLLERARHNAAAEVEILESLDVFPSTLPTRRESTYAGWVSISVGCNNTCTFCIVPSLRGKEKDRRPGDILSEVRALVDEGVLEVTLLGQNVNSYGVEFGDRYAFGKLLRACGEIDGLERVRFTSPHPKDFTDDVIAAMAETPNVCHSLHMPLQSGSDDVLKAMRRSYRSERYLGIIEKVRAAMPDAAITTDIIVGFPGETEADFQRTLDVVRESRFSSAFTFQYSKRPGTPAATMDGQLPKQVVQERYERLIACVEDISWAENKRLVGEAVEVLVAVGEGRKDERTGRLSGRARDGRLVHFDAGSFAGSIRPGDIVQTTVTYAAPHHLNADGAPLSHRRTRAGDAAEAGRSPRTPGVLLGLPTIGAPAVAPAPTGGCAAH